jgi:hypothetical protein
MLRRWLSRLTAPFLRSVRAAGALLRLLNPTALYGLFGLALIFGGLAAFSVPVACVVTGALIFLDATRPEPAAPAPPAK